MGVIMITQLKKGTLEMCVLSILDKEDQYGYELVTLISREVEVTVGTIYPLLNRMKKEGLIESETRDSPDGPSRKYYHLTDKGREALTKSVNEWHRFSAGINRILGGLFNE